jgi:hypothetical protein
MFAAFSMFGQRCVERDRCCCGGGGGERSDRDGRVDPDGLRGVACEAATERACGEVDRVVAVDRGVADAEREIGVSVRHGRGVDAWKEVSAELE